MGLPKLKTKTGVGDYLEGEKFSPVKHEFICGEVYAMAGTTMRHNILYQRIPSLQEYAIVDRHKMNVEVRRPRSNGTWITHYFDEPDDKIEFASVKLTLPITEIYRRARFNK